MKKILGLTVTAILVMALVGGGTWAYFSDPESSTNNALTAGTLDLNINDADDPVTMFSVVTVVPGDSGTGTVKLSNGGVAGELDIAIGAITNTESTGPGEYLADAIGSGGELGAFAKIAIYLDTNQNGSFDSSDIGLNPTDNSTYAPGSLSYDFIDNFGGVSWSDVVSAFSGSDDFIIEWQVPFGTSATNTYQGDAISFDITFTLEQAAVD